MTTKPIQWASALLAFAVSAVFAASEDTKEVALKVGSLAPKLQTGKWVQGEPVTDFQRGKAYLVAFWGTWSPCNPTILFLSPIQEKYQDKGLIVIGQTCWEREEGQVEAFVRRFAEMEKLEPPESRGFMTRLFKLNMFLEREDSKGVNQATAELSEACKDDAPFQSMLARQLLLDERIKERDLNLAEKIATRANAVAEGKDPAVLDTLARALFMNHKPDKAIEIQKQAVELAKDEMKDNLQATLDSYKKGELPKLDSRSSMKFEW